MYELGDLIMSFFRIVSTATGNIIKFGFVNKMDAKVERDKLNVQFNKDRSKDDPFRSFHFIVMRDSGHRLGASLIPKNIHAFYRNPLAIRVTKETREFYKNKKKVL